MQTGMCTAVAFPSQARLLHQSTGPMSFRVERDINNDPWQLSQVGMWAGRWMACPHVHEAVFRQKQGMRWGRSAGHQRAGMPAIWCWGSAVSRPAALLVAPSSLHLIRGPDSL